MVFHGDEFYGVESVNNLPIKPIQDKLIGS